jgi:hypothetical protein
MTTREPLSHRFLRNAVAAAAAAGGGCLFDAFIAEVERHADAPAHTLAELRAARSTKTKGDVFETFCCLYLVAKKGYRAAWRLQDVPRDIAESLHVTGRDMGIDLVAQRTNGTYDAVQCKYRISTGVVPGTRIRKDVVAWKDLATFYALCGRTGPWSKHIVMTNAVAVRGIKGVPKGPKDTSICHASFKSLTTLEALDMLRAGSAAEAAAAPPEAASPASTAAPATVEALRAARVAYYARHTAPPPPPTVPIDERSE